MRTPTMILLCSLVLCGGVASADDRISPVVATVNADAKQPLALVVAPVQLDQSALLDLHGDVQPARAGVVIIDSDCDSYKSGEAPTLPYGAFLVTIGNPSNLPITIRPSQLSLVAGGKTHAAIADRKTLEKRWEDTLWQDFGTYLYRHFVMPTEAQLLHDELPILDGTVTVRPHGAWVGYVVFDVGAKTYEDYAGFLRDAHSLAVRLTLPKTTETTTFVAAL